MVSERDGFWEVARKSFEYTGYFRNVNVNCAG